MASTPATRWASRLIQRRRVCGRPREPDAPARRPLPRVHRRAGPVLADGLLPPAAGDALPGHPDVYGSVFQPEGRPVVPRLGLRRPPRRAHRFAGVWQASGLDHFALVPTSTVSPSGHDGDRTCRAFWIRPGAQSFPTASRPLKLLQQGCDEDLDVMVTLVPTTWHISRTGPASLTSVYVSQASEGDRGVPVDTGCRPQFTSRFCEASRWVRACEPSAEIAAGREHL